MTVKDDGALLAEPAVPLTFTRPGEAGVDCIVGSLDGTVQAICAWDAVFAACENFFGPDPIEGEVLPSKQISIRVRCAPW